MSMTTATTTNTELCDWSDSDLREFAKTLRTAIKRLGPTEYDTPLTRKAQAVDLELARRFGR